MAFDTTFCPEPGQPIWVANRSIETRQRHADLCRCQIRRWPIAPSSCAPSPQQPDRRAELIQVAHEKLAKAWPQVEALQRRPVRCALSRTLPRSAPHYDWRPTAEQMAEARKLVRPLQRGSSFVEQLRDTRQPIVFTYVRRPNYYAAFASAPRVISEQQRLGLTFRLDASKPACCCNRKQVVLKPSWGTSAGGPLPCGGDPVSTPNTER
jgi:hypothetical protein